MSTFKDLGIEEDLLKAIADLGYENPTEVQEKAIPLLLSEKTDLISLAQTGTGKTAAFGFPLIQKIDSNSRQTQGLIISPTRELCLQITNELKNYSKYKKTNIVAVYGGADIMKQHSQIKRGAQIIVATPGRLKDMIGRRMIDISNIQYCILDEADEMLNMGFYDDIKEILSGTPDSKDIWLFSATMPKEVSQIASRFMKKPQEITIGSKNSSSDNVTHNYYLVNNRDRYQALKRLLDVNPETFSVIFCRTKRETQSVAEKLLEDGYNSNALHGDLSQNQRDLVMKSFRNRQIQILVATDVAARGIDVNNITSVIHYQLPDEPEVYNHRSGRTGRAGKSGHSMIIATNNDLKKVKQIERTINKKILQNDIPTGDEICKNQLFYLVHKVRDAKVNEQIAQYLPKIYEELDGFTTEDIISKMLSIEFDKFVKYYSKHKNLSPSKGKSKVDENTIRVFLNIGESDGLDWKSLKDLVTDSTSLSKEDITGVDVMQSFSFMNIGKDDFDKIAVLSGERHNGRKISVEKASTPGGGGGRKRSFGGGGRRRDSDSRNKSFGNNRSGGSSRDRNRGGRSGNGGGRSFGGNSSSSDRKRPRKRY